MMNAKSRLSQHEALQFLKDILGILEPEFKLLSDHVSLVNEVIQAFSEKIPFQNLDLLSQDVNDKHLPTWDEIYLAVKQKRGGLCYTLNVFMKELLAALGFDVYHAACAIFHPNNHIVTVVKDLTHPGSKHLVDISGYPIFEAIALDFKVESNVYRHSFLQYKFVIENNLIVRFHCRDKHDSVNMSNSFLFNGWVRFCEIDLTPRHLSYFNCTMARVYTDPDASYSFFKTLRLLRFPKLKAVGVKDDFEFTEGANHQLNFKKLSKLEAISFIEEHFSQFCGSEIETALSKLQFFTV
ncbi:uncharacterized protein LOC143238417 [Tachypleus tridentatus]|uniref:uncharacterized protein LOC143238417 n=1 Tax=Tachypleus tridentatus TaxID=6853 RepID=UPI003FD00B4C